MPEPLTVEALLERVNQQGRNEASIDVEAVLTPLRQSEAYSLISDQIINIPAGTTVGAFTFLLEGLAKQALAVKKSQDILEKLLNPEDASG